MTGVQTCALPICFPVTIGQVGYSAEQSEWSVRCAEKWNTQVLAAVALHPNEAPVVEDLEKDLAVIDRLASHPRVRAIGETGFWKAGYSIGK